MMKHKKKVLAATILTGAIASEIIVGNLNWWLVEDETDPVVNSTADSVLYLSLPGARCTGTVIGPGLIMSNFHCLGDGLGKFKVTPDYVKSITTTKRKWFNCENVIDANRELDYSIAECDLNLPVVKFNIDPVIEHENIFLVHQNCDWKLGEDTGDRDRAAFCKPYKIVSHGSITGINKTTLHHDGDTLGGSSGSGVFNSDGEVICLHNKGIGDLNRDGRGDYNSCVSIRKIFGNFKESTKEKINIVGDIDSIQGTYTVPNDRPKPSRNITIIKKKSFKCRYFSWLFTRKCK